MAVLDDKSMQNLPREGESAHPGREWNSYSEPGSVTNKIAEVIFARTPLWWWVGFALSFILLLVFIFNFLSIAIRGTGLWNINVPVVWGVGIVNLIFWIGIGHAGTFISAFLLLMRQHWRGAFSRFAEAMTLFALATAGLFPLLHLGRIELFYYIVPYPNTMNLFTQFRSALAWDFVAITAYGTISLLFWYIDLIPDLAAMRDKAKSPWVKFAFGIGAMGWRGESRHWQALHKTSYALAALATPLVISVHSIVGLDFAIAIAPGWHHTLFPPFFVAGAIFSGLAMVIIFATILRSGFGMQKLITTWHLEAAAKLMLTAGLLVCYGYLIENISAYIVGHDYEVDLLFARLFGDYAISYWFMIFCNAIVIQLLWFKRIRTNPTALVIISLFVLIGMWLERYIIIPVSLSYPYGETMWSIFNMGFWDILTIVSPFGLFLTATFLFIRFLPVVPINEAQQVAIEDASPTEALARDSAEDAAAAQQGGAD